MVLCCVACSSTAHSSERRYVFVANVTKRYEPDHPRPSDILLLLGKGVELCVRHADTWTGDPQWGCSYVSGPTQVRLAQETRSLLLTSKDDQGKTTSEYKLTAKFEPGHLYEVFYTESEDKVNWQLYEVDSDHYGHMHLDAPKQLQLIPRQPGALVW